MSTTEDQQGGPGPGDGAVLSATATAVVDETPGARTAAPPPAGRGRRSLVVKVIGIVVGVVVLYEIPLLFDRSSNVRFTQMIAFAVAALGLNLLTGYNGQISVGHSAFMGIGAYSTAIMMSRYSSPFWLTVIVGMVIAFLVGVIVGLPALRIRGVYLALVTLALATMFPQLLIRFPAATGGTTGISLEDEHQLTTPTWVKNIFPGGLRDNQYRFYLAAIVAVVAFVLVRNLMRSRSGRALVAIRDNEISAATLGVDVGLYKVLTFGLSAVLAAIGGSLFAMDFDQVVANQFGVQLSITLLTAIVVGGVATTVGPLVGAIVVVYVNEFFSSTYFGLKMPGVDHPDIVPVLFGVTLIVLMRFAPDGIVGMAKRGWALVRRGRSARRARDSDAIAA
jgi:branched-chain amino acid transport system permease protein